MNPAEQKKHRKVTEDLAADIEAVRGDLKQVEESLVLKIGEERTHRLKLADEQRSYVDNEDRMLRQSIQQLQGLTVLVTSTFWQRLRWLVTGR